MELGVSVHVVFLTSKGNSMNKYVLIALVVSAVAAFGACRYFGSCCLCSGCPCAQKTVEVPAEEVVTVEAPAEEAALKNEAVASEKPADCCCGQVCADAKNNDVK